MGTRIGLAVLAVAMLCPGTRAGKTYVVDPKAGKATNTGSAKSPWRTLEEVVAQGKLSKLKGGDRILLKSGYHGSVTFSGDNDKPVTIEAAKDATPTLSRLEITKGSKWIIRGLTISSSFSDKPVKGVLLKVADHGPSNDIIVEDCFVYTTLDTSKWTAKDWMSANSGVFMGRHGTGHVLRNCYILNTRFAVALCSEGCLCEGNVISDFSADGIRVTRDGQTVQHNVIKNIYVSAKDGDKNHDDAIQCFLFNKGTGTVRNVTVRENLIIMRENPKQKWPAVMQAVGFFDGPLIGFVVEGNVINTSHWHGVSLYDAQDCKILDNVIYTQWTEAKLRPWVELGSKKKGPVKGNVVKNNYACSFRLMNDKGVEEANNKPITEKVYKKRFKKLLAKIEETYGKYHPVAKFARVGTKKGTNTKK